MKRNAVVVLVIAIVLLVFGVALSMYGIHLDISHSLFYDYGATWRYVSVRWSPQLYGVGNLISELGHLLFFSGLVMMIIFTILVVNERKNDTVLSDKERKAYRAEAEKARAGAMDASVHEEGKENPSDDNRGC